MEASTPGRGSMFRVFLPTTDGQDDAVPLTERSWEVELAR